MDFGAVENLLNASVALANPTRRESIHRSEIVSGDCHKVSSYVVGEERPVRAGIRHP